MTHKSTTYTYLCNLCEKDFHTPEPVITTKRNYDDEVVVVDKHICPKCRKKADVFIRHELQNTPFLKIARDINMTRQGVRYMWQRMKQDYGSYQGLINRMKELDLIAVAWFTLFWWFWAM